MQVPLFPLHTVLAPGIALPIHVFEDRYRALVRRCLATGSPFGIVLIREGSEVAPAAGESQELAVAAVGTLAEIREARELEDGRWMLLVVGAGRFVVREVHADLEPYLVAEADPLEDAVGDMAAAEALVGRIVRRFADYLRVLQPREGEAAEPIDVQVEVEVPEGGEGGDDEEGDTAAAGGGAGGPSMALRIPDDPSSLSFLLTGIVQVEPAVRQALLEAPTAEARLRDLDALLDRELLLLERRLAPFVPDRDAGQERRN